MTPWRKTTNCQVRNKILRHTTPYHINGHEGWNQLAVKYNAIATEFFLPVGFWYVNTFEILEPLKDLSLDGVHYILGRDQNGLPMPY